MSEYDSSTSQIRYVSDFQSLLSTPFYGEVNAMCWAREPEGNFEEIVRKLESDEAIRVIDPDDLLQLTLSPEGSLARHVLLQDLALLQGHGAAPVLNLIRNYERDTAYPFFPTDVYSYHVDRSPVPTDTFLCTYYGAPSELIANAWAEQKIQIPVIRKELEKLYEDAHGEAEAFEDFLKAHFFDLHYQAMPGAKPVNLGLGRMWRLAVDYPDSRVLPCVHRAPVEKDGEPRLLLIC